MKTIKIYRRFLSLRYWLADAQEHNFHVKTLLGTLAQVKAQPEIKELARVELSRWLGSILSIRKLAKVCFERWAVQIQGTA
jgi:hypothetical protein